MKFPANIKYLRNAEGKTQVELANELGLNRSNLNNYENGLAEPTLEVMLRLADHFGVSMDTLLRTDLTLLNENQLAEIKRGGDAFVKGRTLRVVATTVGDDNIDNIELVEAKAQAGYLSGFADPEFIEHLPVFRLPFLNPNRKYRTFQIVGESMLPIPVGAWITAEYLDDWTTIKSGEAAIILTVDDGLAFKIVENRIETSGMLNLISLNPLFKPYTVRISEVREIWRFVLFISPFLPTGNINHEQIMVMLGEIRNSVDSIKKVN
jgi:transcriptional regulator with XRE-family HTH domain